MEEWIKLSHFPLLLPSNIIYNPAKKNDSVKWKQRQSLVTYKSLETYCHTPDLKMLGYC